MKIVLQRVSEAMVTADGTEVGRIGKGYVLLPNFPDASKKWLVVPLGHICRWLWLMTGRLRWFWRLYSVIHPFR